MVLSTEFREIMDGSLVFGVMFDKFDGVPHFRVIPSRLDFGVFEAYLAEPILERKKSGIFDDLRLTELDKQILDAAYVHRQEIGNSDGMGTPPGHVKKSDWPRVRKSMSPGSSENNYTVSAIALTDLYNSVPQEIWKRKNGVAL